MEGVQLDPSAPSRAFYFSLNPRRADRHRGGGRRDAPSGWESIHGGCYLCGENIAWQQRFTQFSLPIELGTGLFDAWVNPFPLGQWHLTIASREHRPQRWQVGTRETAKANLLSRLDDLMELAQRLPRFLVFENGVGAGASIPGHHHYQALCRWPGLDHFPIEEAALASRRNANQESALLLENYPVSAIACGGNPDAVRRQARVAIDRWFSDEASLDWDHLTTNLIASRARADREELWLFLVPRNAHINRSHGTDSHVASLEIAGELVMSDPKARDRIQSGKISYRSAWETIASCQDTGSRRLLERVFSENP